MNIISKLYLNNLIASEVTSAFRSNAAIFIQLQITMMRRSLQFRVAFNIQLSIKNRNSDKTNSSAKTKIMRRNYLSMGIFANAQPRRLNWRCVPHKHVLCMASTGRTQWNYNFIMVACRTIPNAVGPKMGVREFVLKWFHTTTVTNQPTKIKSNSTESLLWNIKFFW